MTVAIAGPPPARPPVAVLAQHVPDVGDGAREYAELKRRLAARGLLARHPARYTGLVAATIGLLAVGLTVLVLVGVGWVQVLNAVFLAFVSTQLFLLAHD